MNENFDDCHHRKTTRTFMYKKQKKLRNIFIFKKPDNFQKARQFPLFFLIQKAIHLTLRDFMKFSKLAFKYKKHDALLYVTFLYSKI